MYVFVFFSDDGRLHKAININNKMHIIEEMVVLRDSQPVQHIELDSEKVQSSARRRDAQFVLSSSLAVRSNNKLAKCIYWQFRNYMSHEVLPPKGKLMFSEIITWSCLSGELQTAAYLTAGIS